MPFRISIQDALTPWIQKLAAEGRTDLLRPALASLGWWTQREIKEGILSRSPGGRPYPEWMPQEMRERLQDSPGHKQQTNWGPLGDVYKGVGYDKRFLNEGVVIVGWTSGASGLWGKRLQAGMEPEITPKMRRYFFARGIPLGRKTRLEIPGRPTIHPMFEALKGRFGAYAEAKIMEYLEKGLPEGVSVKRRTYRVLEGF